MNYATRRNSSACSSKSNELRRSSKHGAFLADWQSRTSCLLKTYRRLMRALAGLVPWWSGWIAVLVATLLLYFYSHYAFASITTHLLAMYSAFVALLIQSHAPLGLIVFSFACSANLSAGLTHYGTTPAPMFFAKNYVSLKRWWTIGFVASIVNILIWGTIGFGWWRLILIW